MNQNLPPHYQVQKTDQSGQRPVAGLIDFVKTVLYAAVFVFVLRVFAFEPFMIPSGSMVPTLVIGDYFICF